MPYKDPEQAKAHAKAYRKALTESGYGKVIYARRKMHYQNEEILRDAIHQCLVYLAEGNTRRAKKVVNMALDAAPKIDRKPTPSLAKQLMTDWQGVKAEKEVE